jgi:hypothetical protein
LRSTGNPTIAPLKWAGVLLNYEARIFCTAQFISPKVVLTAAHCVQNAENGEWYDLDKMYFLAQYQNTTSSQVYRPVCLSRYDGWWPPQLRDAQTAAEKNRAASTRWQWDYAMILMDRESSTGHYPKWEVDWAGKYREATGTGYPTAMLQGQVIQAARGELQIVPNLGTPNVVVLKHNVADLTQGSSGGAWVANFGREEDADHNRVVSVSSFYIVNQPGISFGPYLTADFAQLFEYVSKGCPG